VKANSITTVSIYLRAVRAAWNLAKPGGVKYPFGKKREGLYQIGKGRNIKKALQQADVARIASFAVVEGSSEHWARDLWLFSYLCAGANMKDISLLKWSNISGDKLKFIRAKTADTTEEKTEIEVIISRQIGRIIDRWANRSKQANDYIFPILSHSMTPEEQYKTIHQVVKQTNKYMKRVCEELELPPVTTYGARHSFATVLKRSGASIEFISESLGHKNQSTTQRYLDSFEDDEKRKWSNVLLPE
jgi:integrase